MALKAKASKAKASKSSSKKRQKKDPIPGSAIHKSMVLRGLIKEKKSSKET